MQAQFLFVGKKVKHFLALYCYTTFVSLYDAVYFCVCGKKFNNGHCLFGLHRLGTRIYWLEDIIIFTISGLCSPAIY